MASGGQRWGTMSSRGRVVMVELTSEEREVEWEAKVVVV